MSNTFTKGYVDGSALTEAMLDTAYQSLQLDIANTALTSTGSTSGQVLTSNGSGVAASFQTIPDPQGPFALRNYGIKGTVAAGVLTISLTTKAGSAPSGSDVVNFNYSANGTTSASYSTVNITSATTLSVNASATLGGVGTAAQPVYIYGYYNTAVSAVKLAVSRIPNFDSGIPASMSAISAAGDSAGALYASASLIVIPRLLGRIVLAQSSAGAWQTPTKTTITNLSTTAPWESNRGPTTSAALIGQIVRSGSCGAFTTSGTVYTDVTALSVTLATTGRPVYIGIQGDGSGNLDTCIASNNDGTTTGTSSHFKILRDATEVAVNSIGFAPSGAVALKSITHPSSSLFAIDSPAAGTYTYKLQARGHAATDTATVNYSKLFAYEI